MSTPNLNVPAELQPLAAGVYNPIYQLVTDIANGTADDLRSYAGRLTEALTAALADGDKEALDSLGRTAELLAEKQRVTFRNSTARAFGRVLATIGAIGTTMVGVLSQGATAALADLLGKLPAPLPEPNVGRAAPAAPPQGSPTPSGGSSTPPPRSST